MSPEEIIYFAAIVLIGVPAGITLRGRIRNSVAFMMVATWIACRLLYWATGEGMPLPAMVVSDMFVIAAMIVKDDWRECSYATIGKQFAALWHERTPWDRGILAIFPFVWLFYAPITGAVTQFWTLWSLSLAQLMLAGWEGLYLWRRANGQTSRAADERPPGLEFTAWERGYG